MERGKLYGVSVGPGDPELLTLKAVRVLKVADVIAAPDPGGGRQTALGIVGELVDGKPVLDCSTPMCTDSEVVERAHRASARRICELLDEGKRVAFVTIGDAGVYSTFFYLFELVSARGYEVDVVPGVTSFCAAAARLGIPLCEGSEQLHIVPVSGSDRIDDALALSGTRVFMKSGRSLPSFRRELERRGLLGRAALVENCGYGDERVYEHFSDAPDGLADYFAIVILK